MEDKHCFDRPKQKCVFLLIQILIYFVFICVIVKLVKWEEDTKKDIYSQKEKFRRYYNMVFHWLSSDADGRKIKNFLDKNEIQKIAVYGNGDFGSILAKQLRKDDLIEIVCFIDRSSIKQGQSSEEIPVIDCGELDQWKDVIDAVIVTPILDFESVKKDLEFRTKAEIISIESIIYDNSEEELHEKKDTPRTAHTSL